MLRSIVARRLTRWSLSIILLYVAYMSLQFLSFQRHLPYPKTSHATTVHVKEQKLSATGELLRDWSAIVERASVSGKDAVFFVFYKVYSLSKYSSF